LGAGVEKAAAEEISSTGNDDLEGCEGGGRDRRRRCGSEKEAAGAIHQVAAEGRGSRDEGTGGSDGLAERSDQDVRLNVKLSGEAASPRAKTADGMCFVDDEDGVVGFGQGGQLGQWGDVAIHAEEGLGDEEAAAGGGAEPFEEFLGTIEVEMRVDGQLGAGKATAVDDAGVNRVVHEDQVRGTGECRDDPEIGLIARRKQQGGRSSDQGSERIL